MRLLVLVACAALLSSACGVSSQDRPVPLEESTQPAPTAIPSFDTKTSPPPSTADTLRVDPTSTTVSPRATGSSREHP